jgi:hypothetical protein
MSTISRLLILTGLCWPIVLLGQSPPPQPLQVSLIQLIATPDKFDGKLIYVCGLLEMSREGDLLFLDQSDRDNVILSNAIWVRRTEQMGKDRLTLNGKYVAVVGIFRVGFKEQLGTPGNGIPEVSHVEFWSDPNHPLDQRIRQIPGVSSNP